MEIEIKIERDSAGGATRVACNLRCNLQAYIDRRFAAARACAVIVDVGGDVSSDRWARYLRPRDLEVEVKVKVDGTRRVT